MKEVRQAIVLVDSHRRMERRRNTAGRYRVGAKSEKEAEKFVQEAIGFGSVKFYYWEKPRDGVRQAAYKEVLRDCQEDGYPPARHATSPQKDDDEREEREL